MISLVVPSVLLINIKRKRSDTHSVSYDSEEDLTDVPESAGKNDKNKKQMICFEDYPRIMLLLSDVRSISFIDSYIVHYQETDLSNYFSFWQKVFKFKTQVYLLLYFW